MGLIHCLCQVSREGGLLILSWQAALWAVRRPSILSSTSLLHPRKQDEASFTMQNARRGEFSRQKLRGKRAVELGAGMGLCGLAFAVMGAHVLVTDLAPVLPLLRINCEANLSSTVLDGASRFLQTYFEAQANFLCEMSLDPMYVSVLDDSLCYQGCRVRLARSRCRSLTGATSSKGSRLWSRVPLTSSWLLTVSTMRSM